jgi:hypothetical protein
MSFGFANAEGPMIIKGAREMEIKRYRLVVDAAAVEDRAGDPDLRLAHVDSAAQGPG